MEHELATGMAVIVKAQRTHRDDKQFALYQVYGHPLLRE